MMHMGVKKKAFQQIETKKTTIKKKKKVKEKESKK
jgi:hypothetical protein